MVPKLFIVSADNEPIYRTLCRVLENAPLVEVLYDRRQRTALGPWSGQERRVRPDVDERVRTEGYAVVRLTLEMETHQGNIRWSAYSRLPGGAGSFAHSGQSVSRSARGS